MWGHCYSANKVKNLLLQYYPVNINTNVDTCNIHTHNFKCGFFKIKLETENGARKWVQAYNNVTHETMVFQNRGGVRNCTCDVTTDNKHWKE